MPSYKLCKLVAAISNTKNHKHTSIYRYHFCGFLSVWTTNSQIKIRALQRTQHKRNRGREGYAGLFTDQCSLIPSRLGSNLHAVKRTTNKIRMTIAYRVFVQYKNTNILKFWFECVWHVVIRSNQSQIFLPSHPISKIMTSKFLQQLLCDDIDQVNKWQRYFQNKMFLWRN